MCFIINIFKNLEDVLKLHIFCTQQSENYANQAGGSRAISKIINS